jgi:PAS domain S-box-containing protein
MAAETPKPETPIPSGDAFFKQLLEHSAVGLATFSLGGRFLAANPALCRLLGYTEQELLEKTHLDLIHIEDLEVAALTRVQAISGKTKPRILKRRYMHKDGSTVWTSATGTVIRDEAGAPLYTVLFVVDISTMKRALRTSEQRFRRMIEMSSDWYWVQDTEFRFIEIVGLDFQEPDTDVVIGKPRWELPNLGVLPEKVWEQHRARLKRHEPFSDFVFLRYNRARELRYLSVSGEPLFDEQGKFKGYHGVGKDITERARDQKAAADVGGGCEKPGVPRGERGGGQAVRLLEGRVPHHDGGPDPPRGGRRPPAEGIRGPQRRLLAAHLASQKEER